MFLGNLGDTAFFVPKKFFKKNKKSVDIFKKLIIIGCIKIEQLTKGTKMKQLTNIQIVLINAAIFDDCKHLTAENGEPNFNGYRSLSIKGSARTDWVEYFYNGKINMEQHFSFGTLSRRHNVRKGLLNAKQIAFWQGYFTAKFGCDFGINNY